MPRAPTPVLDAPGGVGQGLTHGANPAAGRRNRPEIPSVLSFVRPFLSFVLHFLGSFGAFLASLAVRFGHAKSAKCRVCNKSLASFPLFNIFFGCGLVFPDKASPFDLSLLATILG